MKYYNVKLKVMRNYYEGDKVYTIDWIVCSEKRLNEYLYDPKCKIHYQVLDYNFYGER